MDHDLEVMRQQNIGRLLQRAARAYSELALEKLRSYGYEGLTLFHTMLISNLDTDGTRITILAERAGISKQAMGQIVADLEERHFIVREPDPSDKRAALIQFTDQGRQFLRDSYLVKQAIEAEYTALLGEAEMSELRDLLQKLVGG